MVPRTAPVHTAASAPATRSSTSSDTPTGSHSLRVSINVTSPPRSGDRSPMIPHGFDTQIADTASSNTDLHNHSIPLRNVTESPVGETGGANTVNTIDPMRLLQAPLAFFRSPIRLSLQIHFDTIRIAELNPLTLATIEMPYMLGDHDVYREDWITFVNVSRIALHYPYPEPIFVPIGLGFVISMEGSLPSRRHDIRCWYTGACAHCRTSREPMER
jgi:hypothetical protein